jgi:hypothetical protein
MIWVSVLLRRILPVDIKMPDVLKAVVSFLLVFLVVIFLWYIFWKFVLEPNPLVRDFFDLDTKDRRKIRKEL